MPSRNRLNFAAAVRVAASSVAAEAVRAKSRARLPLRRLSQAGLGLSQ